MGDFSRFGVTDFCERFFNTREFNEGWVFLLNASISSVTKKSV